MAVDLYQPFFNKITGETFKLIKFDEKAYVTEWSVEPLGYVPFEHVHLQQDEVFHILQGELLLNLNGRALSAKAGQSLTVPRGIRHIASNASPERLVCKVEYVPGLDMLPVFQCMAGLTVAGDMTGNGLVNPLKMMYFMQALKSQALARPAYLPEFVFLGLMKMAYLIGAVLGWEAQLNQFTRA